MKLTHKLSIAATLAAALIGNTAFADGDLRIIQRQDPANLDPVDTFLVAWGSIGSNIYDGLVRRDENLDLQPGLATSWEVAEDGMKIRFNLREGVTFHNGEPFTAESVKYTFDRLLGDVGAQGPQRSNYTPIKSIEIIDDYTVDMHMNQADPVMLTKLSGYGAMIVPKNYIEEVGEDTFDLQPIGTGPFKLAEYTQGVGLKLVANEDYFEGAPELDSLNYRFIREASTRLAELQSGGADVVSDVAFSAIPTLEGANYARIESTSGPEVMSFSLKTKDAITEDVRVRRALNMAVDKQTIVDAFLAGRAEPIASLQGPLSFGYDPELDGYPYDPAAAKALLDEAGVAPGTEITIDYRTGNAAVGEVAQALTGFFAGIGLNAKLNPLEDAIFLNEIVPNGRTNEVYQFNWGGWTFDFDNTAYLLYKDGERWNPYGTSEEMNQLLEEQRTVVDTQEREKMLQRVAELAHEEAYSLPLYVLDTVYAVSNRVENFTPAPDRRMRYTDVTLSDQ